MSIYTVKNMVTIKELEKFFGNSWDLWLDLSKAEIKIPKKTFNEFVKMHKLKQDNNYFSLAYGFNKKSEEKEVIMLICNSDYGAFKLISKEY